MITEKEREIALGLLTRSRQTLLDAVAGVTEAQAAWKPNAERWSVQQYVEHLAISDDGLIAMIRKSLREPPVDETPEELDQRRAKIRSTQMPRGVNKAPEVLRPDGRFPSLADAVSGFLAARERTLDFARTTQDDLHRHFFPHSVLGPMSGYEWLVANARHAELHAGHIKELRAMDGFAGDN
jgi:hypothetical protein